MTTTVVESMEENLKRDVIREVRAGEGRILLHDEVEERPGVFSIIPIWEHVEEKDIMFIYGFIKTTVWNEAAFNEGSSNIELVLSGGVLTPAPLVSGEIRLAHSHASDPLIIHRSGPPDRVIEWERRSACEETFDQCIFLNFYKMKRRIWRQVIRAAAGPHELPSGPNCDMYSSQTSVEAYSGGEGVGAEVRLEFNHMEGFLTQ